MFELHINAYVSTVFPEPAIDRLLVSTYISYDQGAGVWAKHSYGYRSTKDIVVHGFLWSFSIAQRFRWSVSRLRYLDVSYQESDGVAVSIELRRAVTKA